MLRVEDLEKQLEKEFKYNESLMARLVGFMRKEAVEKEAEIEPVPSEEDNDDEEDLLDAHVVQFGINFDNHVEIYLTYIK
jgi:hypothetical protein